VATRDGGRLVLAALGSARRRRPEDRRARVHRAPRPSAIRGPPDQRRARAHDHECRRCVRHVRRLSRTHARRADRARHRRSVSRGSRRAHQRRARGAGGVTYWQTVPGAANTWRASCLVCWVTTPALLTVYAKLAWLPSTKVSFALPTTVSATA